ncbi:vacuolar protein sorting-associated-like protein [Histomonas meleagridis]|uniref:vacuolar protein sorting-associated-like protein n=1 Tax=Histomonas meleagridis TaxID=135588 RepID=UPI00355985DF|nr:vacuolar protein sorting-associated-like protein [Histomonas meleagridis]KAH0800654.1 vacuolar protein sorting-associated-like protein [Histomonas meleagridis]
MNALKIPEYIQNLIKDNRLIEARKECIKNHIDAEYLETKVQNLMNSADVHYSKKEYKQSIDDYIKVIGFVEPSIVLCKFIAPHLSIHLTNYLIELHKRGCANAQHTQLLFNLFRHLDAKEMLNDFLQYIETAHEQQIKKEKIAAKEQSGSSPSETSSNEFDTDYENFLNNFNADAAIQTLIDNEMEAEALHIAQVLNRNSFYIFLLISFKQDYEEAANQIALRLPSAESRDLLMKFGPILLLSSSSVVKKIENIAKISWLSSQTPLSSDKQFLKLFASHPLSCINFLQSVIHQKSTPSFANNLIALLISNDTNNSSQEVLDLIDNFQKLKYDPDLVLSLCCQNHFTTGLVKLLTQLNRPHDLVNLLISESSTNQLFKFCETNPDLNNEDWLEIFKFVVSEAGWKSSPPQPFLKKLIENASKAMPLAAIVETLTKNPLISIDVVRSELFGMFTQLVGELEVNETKNKILLKELEEVDNEIERLEEIDIEFKPMKCDRCKNDITGPPYVGFMCGHMFHTREGCVGRGSNNEMFCPICGECNSPNLEQEFVTDEQIDLSKLDLIDEAVKMIDNGLLNKC